MVIDYGKGKVEVSVTLKALMVYEHEFSSDMVQDLFGRMKVSAGKGGDDGMVLDFTVLNWTASLKALWACLKAQSESTPGFKAWLDSIGDINLYEVTPQVVTAVQESLFRS